MFWMTVYFVAAFGCVFTVIFALALLFYRLKVKFVWQLPFYTALVLLPFIPYAKVSIQTARHQDKILPAVRASSIHWGNPKEEYFIFRILDITRSYANVYVMTSCEGGMGTDRKNDKAGLLITLKRSSQGWEFDSYDAAWSDCGSAEGNTFPPYSEAREF